MNKLLLGLVVGGAVGAGVTWSLRHHEEPAHAEPAAAKEKPEENPLHLSPEKRTAAGIVLAAAQRKPLPAEAAAQGRVLDPSPLIGLLAELESTRATLAAADKEFGRVQKLHAQDGNASLQAVETAEADVLRARAQRLAVEARLVAGWGAALARREDLPKLVVSLAAQEVALGRLELIDARSNGKPPPHVRVATLANREAATDAEVLGPAPSADPQSQAAAYLVLLRAQPSPPGTALIGSFAGEGKGPEVVIVPATAVVYHDGSAWVYALGEKDTFQRHRVEIARALGDDVAIADGLDEKAPVVVRGAQQLLSAELQAGAKD